MKTYMVFFASKKANNQKMRWISRLILYIACVLQSKMKGKGKTANDKDCPLQFPDLEPVDHVTQCQKYTNSKCKGY